VRQLGRVAFKKKLIALLPAFERQTDLSVLKQRPGIGIALWRNVDNVDRRAHYRIPG